MSKAVGTKTRAELPDPRHHLANVSVGDRIRLSPGTHERNAWTVGARDSRYVVVWRQAMFHPKGTPEYSVIDLDFPYRYNGQGPGVVRSSLNSLGGGWDIGPNGEHCDSVIDALRNEHWELSHRRLLEVWEVEDAWP